ncbi:KLHL9_13 [Mytilus coruscus]|uniref:KLHL9_13 n=1 Tax=Mytilus coruscus TaxID=42192 RepID=A0A6J8CDJ2_MYTCO|nr:KLHL9_13 [Mytilus coruscus]
MMDGCGEANSNTSMRRTPYKIRVKRERQSLGDFLSPKEDEPTKDRNVLDFSIGNLKAKAQTVENAVEMENLKTIYKEFESRARKNTCNSANGNECGKELSEFLYNLWTQQQLCDIVIRVNGKEFLAHKLALAAHSEKFTSRYCERQRLPSTLSEVNLLNASIEATEEILNFIYTNHLNITDANVDTLIGCAKQLGVSAAIFLCRQHLLNFDSKNVLCLMQIAEKHGFSDILQKMEASVYDNFSEISRKESFLHSQYDRVIKILQRDALRVKVGNELEIFFAIVAWIDFNRQERLSYASQILQCVRFSIISAEDLVKHVEPQTEIFKFPQCKEMLYIAFKTQALEKRSPMHANQESRRQTNQVPFSITGYNNTEQNQSYSCRSVPAPRRHSTGSGTGFSQTVRDCTQNGTRVTPSKEKPTSPYVSRRASITDNTEPVNKIPQMPMHVNQTPMHVNQTPQTKRKLYLGGSLHQQPVQSTAFYGPHSAPIKPSTIMVVGGINPYSPESTYSSKLVEQYNPQNNTWKVVSTLPEPRHHLGTAILDGYIYVVAGSIIQPDEQENLANPTDTCFRFCPEGNYWTRTASLRTARMYHGLAVLEGVLYAVGGHNTDGRSLNSVEYYNPDTDTWGFTESMTEAKIGMATAGYHGLLYVVGGFYESMNDKIVLDTVECYNPRTNNWTVKDPLPTPCCHANLVVVEDKLYLIGGSNMSATSSAVTSLSSVYCYNEEDDMWDKITDIMIPRHDCGTAAIGSKIYIIGGVSSQEGSVLADVECLDVDSLTLVECEPMAYPALGISCCILPGENKN